MLYLVLILVSLTMTVARNSPNYASFRGKWSSLPSEINELVKLDAPSLIAHYGFPVESHTVTTADGYILQAHRIPSNYTDENRKVVFAMHGLLGSSADYLALGRDLSLGCLLADSGYDVWFGNNRGNYYSRAHISLDPDMDSEFWDFSWEEIGRYDLAAMTDYILSVTQQNKIHYIGYSQGATAFVVLNSLRPEYNEKFKSFLALAPAVYFHNNNSPYVRAMSYLEGMVQMASYYIGVYEIAPRNCNGYFWQMSIIDNICCTIIKMLTENVNSVFNLLQQAHTPAGASVRQFIHFAQCIRYQAFRRMYYDTATNIYLYNSEEPPEYDISQLRVPTKIYMGIADIYVNYKDLIDLANDLPDATIHQVDDSEFGHASFLQETKAKHLLYDDIIQVLQIYEHGDYARLKNRLHIIMR